MTRDHMSWCHHPLLKNSEGKYSFKVIGVMSFYTKRSSTCTIVCFLLGSFSSFFFACRWIFCLCCSFLRRFGYEWDSCFLQGLLCVTNIQPPSLYNIDSLSKYKWRRVSWHDTYVCFGFDDLHWIVLVHAPSVLGGPCKETGLRNPNVIVAWFDSTTSSRSKWILPCFESFIMRVFKMKHFSIGWLTIQL